MSMDFELYDRQIRTFGKEATLKINSSSVTIIGLEKGLGTEIAKNLALCGIKNLHLFDDLPITESDLQTGYYYSEKDVKYARSSVLRKKIIDLNPQVHIICDSYDNLKDSNVIVCVNQTVDKIVRYNNLCRKNNIKFISLQSSNNTGILFVDAGDNHVVSNITGENYEPIQVLSCDKEFTFTTNGHEFQTGDIIKFSNLQGSNVEILNNEFSIVANDRNKFKLNVDFPVPYNFNFINGTVTYVDKPVTISHQDYETQIKNPTMNFLSDENLIKNYVHSDIEIISVNSIMGSLVASEAIKLVSGKYQPITQWFTWHDSDLNYELVENKLKESEFFIVGSGAIGCELLKNLAFLNVKKITITDPDTIEKSNLSRQFLFRANDVGKLKSEIASKAIKNMKPTLDIHYLAEKVGSNNINFTDKILKTEGLTAVFNALDNIDARRFMDNECFNHNVALFESGTMGIKGNTQPVIPFLTETYSNSNDPPTEKSFAVCTIKNFPNEIQHTIHWALDQFEFFNRAPTNINLWLKNKNMKFEETTEGIQMNKDVWLFTTKYKNTFDDYVRWAIDMFYEYFNNQIIQLLNNFPADTVTSEGNLFWSAGKRCPKPIKLDIENNLHMDFIIATIALLCNSTNIQFTLDVDRIIDIINKYEVKEFIPEKKEEKEEKTSQLLEINETIDIKTCCPQVFEKDDDTNYHVMWINTASNIRATNYSIEPVDFHTTKGIAGRIIPAVATTTSIVAGLITIEMIKYLNHDKIENFKSTFVNLALNVFVSADPIEAKKKKIAGQEFNSWFKFIEKEDLVLEDFLNKYNELFKTTITMVSLESSLIYADFMGSDTSKTFSELIKEYDDNKKDKYILTLSCEDETVDLPDIILTI
jgi:ubiquitin-activating enzyme E1